MEDVSSTLFGAIAGVAISLLITALRYSRKTRGGGWFSFWSSQLLLLIILASVGAFVGSIVGGA